MKRLWLMLFLLCCLCQAQADISASLDRSQVAMGETVTLTLSATDGDSIGQPDLSVLSPDFRVLSQSSSSNIRIVNGHMDSSKTLAIRLLPKRIGTLTIPALTTASGSTQPLQLTVSNSSATNGNAYRNNGQQANANRDLFVAVDVSPKQVYVGQQVTVKVKLYYAVNLNGGSLDPLSVTGASVQPLGKEQKFSANLHGRSYQVYEQDYALFPSTSGTLTLPSIAFQGQVLTAGSSNFFGMNVPGFGMPTPVTAASDPVTLSVKPIPADWKGLWLPAHKINLGASGIPADNTLTVGVPLNLHLSISALGLPASSLPDLSLPDIDNASTYADKSDSKTGQAGDLVKGEKSRTFAILPQHPGKLTLPATRLSWFNTTTGKQETIELPAHSFTVVAAAGTTATGSPTGSAVAAQPANPAPATSAVADSGSPVAPANPARNNWKWAFFASLGLWLLLVIVLWWRRRKPAPAKPAPISQTAGGKRAAQQRCLQQLQQQDKQALTSLLAWAASERPGITLTGLKLAVNEPQASLIARLEAWCYAQQSFPVDATTAFAKGLDWHHAQGRKQATVAPLAELYPTDDKPPR